MTTKDNRPTIGVMAQAIIEMFADKPKETAFTIDQMARYAAGGRKPTAATIEWARGQLARARKQLEDVEGMVFIPVTDFYFEHYYGQRPPRSNNGAVKCVAGIGYGGSRKTAGIRKLWIGFKNDGMAELWLKQGYKSGSSKWKKTTDRVLIGFKKGRLTKSFAAAMVKDGFIGTLPNDRKTFNALLPEAARHKLIGNGK
jgi:hypothetical protein